VSILKQVMEEDIKSTNVEIATVNVNRKFQAYSSEQIAALIDIVNRKHAEEEAAHAQASS
jgi:20S proteasome alpha/beta subunit